MITAPTFAATLSRVRNDVLAETGEDATAAGTWPWAVAYVWTGIVWAVYAAAEAASKSALATTAAGDALRRLAAARGVTPKAAARAVGEIRILGDGVAIVPKGTTIQRVSDGIAYEVTADHGADFFNGTIWVYDAPVRAVERGADGNCVASTAMELASPVRGLQTACFANGAISGGTSSEEDVPLRARLISRYQTPLCGAASGDWVDRVLAGPLSSGAVVGEVWTVTNTPPSVTVLFALSGGVRIPAAGDVTEVQAALAAVEPANVPPGSYVAQGVTQALIPLSVHLYTDTPANRLAVVAALDAFWLTVAPGATAWNSDVRGGLSGAGLPYRLDSLNLDGTGLSDFSLAPGAVPKTGVVTWT